MDRAILGMLLLVIVTTMTACDLNQVPEEVACNRAGVFVNGELVAPTDEVFGEPSFGDLQEHCPQERGTFGVDADQGYGVNCSGLCCTYIDPILNPAHEAVEAAGLTICVGASGLERSAVFHSSQVFTCGELPCAGLFGFYYCAPECGSAAGCPDGLFCAGTGDVPLAPEMAGYCIPEALRDTVRGGGTLPEESMPTPTGETCPEF